MPLARGIRTGPVTPTTPGTPVPGRAVVPEPGIFVPEFIAPNGVVLPLNAPGSVLHSTRGVSGLGLAPREIVATDNPEGGTVVEFTRVRERTIIWPVRLYADTHEEFITAWRSVGELLALTESMNKPGLLRITRGFDGSRREIPCYYQSGFEQEAEDAAWLRGGGPLNLYCPQPWWQDVTPQLFEARQGVPSPYLSPYPTYSAGQVIGETTMTNLGQREAWPSWTIRGPLSQLIATNTTRGESFTLTYPLERGETITISSKPVQVRGPGGEQLISAVNRLTGGVLWRLNPRVPGVFSGENKIVFAASGAAGESAPGAKDETLIRLEITQFYETA